MAGAGAPGAQRRGPPLLPMEGERGEVGVRGAGPRFTGDSGAGRVGARLLRALREGLGRSIHRVRGAFVCASRGAALPRRLLLSGPTLPGAAAVWASCSRSGLPGTLGPAPPRG